MARVSKKALAEKAIQVATIYNRSIKSKSELRAESADAVTLFLKKGGVIQECKPSRRKSGSKMTCKPSKGFQNGTAGFANGFPKGSSAFK
jgi:hypothetical protein